MSAVVFVVWFRYGANTITVDTNLLYVM